MSRTFSPDALSLSVGLLGIVAVISMLISGKALAHGDWPRLGIAIFAYWMSTLICFKAVDLRRDKLLIKSSSDIIAAGRCHNESAQRLSTQIPTT